MEAMPCSMASARWCDGSSTSVCGRRSPACCRRFVAAGAMATTTDASLSCAITYDKELYNARSEVQCTFSLLEQARRFATRYEKTLRNDAGVVALGCAMLWLRS